MAPVEVPAVWKRRSRLSGGRKPVVQAESFEVVDAGGRVVARLGPIPGAEAHEVGTGLILFDQTGVPRLTLGLDLSGPSLHLTAAGTVRLSLAVVDAEPVPMALLAVREVDGTETFSVSV
jgi:hypothetical protein